jgi:hypothetical protein
MGVGMGVGVCERGASQSSQIIFPGRTIRVSESSKKKLRCP